MNNSSPSKRHAHQWECHDWAPIEWVNWLSVKYSVADGRIEFEFAVAFICRPVEHFSTSPSTTTTIFGTICLSASVEPSRAELSSFVGIEEAVIFHTFYLFLYLSPIVVEVVVFVEAVVPLLALILSTDNFFVVANYFLLLFSLLSVDHRSSLIGCLSPLPRPVTHSHSHSQTGVFKHSDSNSPSLHSAALSVP